MDDLVPGERFVLRRFRLEDADDVARACDDPLVARFMSHLPQPYTRADAVRWITEGSVAAFAAGGAAYAATDAATGELVGSAGCGEVRNGIAEIGYWVAPWARERGVGTAIARQLVAHAHDCGLHRLVLRTRLGNAASQRVAIAAGFVREGVQRGGGRGRDGNRHDMIVWARLADDPDGPSPRLLPDLPGYGDRSRRGGSPEDGPFLGELTDGVVTLRPYVPADAEALHELRTLDDVVATSVPPTPPSLDQIRARCEHAQAAWLAGQRADLTVCDAATGAFAGDIGLFYVEPPTAMAMIGYSVSPPWRGRGYATRAARLITGWAFEHAGIARVIAGTAPENVGSQRVLERAGFQREGYQRARLPGPSGGRIDDVLYAVLAPLAAPASEITP